MVVARRKTMKKTFKQPTAEDMILDYVATGRKDLVEEYLDNGGTPRVFKLAICFFEGRRRNYF